MTGERDRNVLLLLTGLFAVWLSLSGAALDFVRPSMRPFVLLAGVVVVLLAVLPPGGLLGRSAGSGHDHGTGVAWLLVAPLLVVILVPPAPLGANAVPARRASGRSTGGAYPPVGAAVDGAVTMSMAEFATRALRDRARSLDGIRVRLVGFVTGGTGDGYGIARFVIFCCAADAEAVEVVVRDDSGARRTDSWVEVVGVWEPSGDLPVLRAESARAVGKPRKPYEYTAVWSG